MTAEEDDGILKEARNYVDTFWSNHSEKHPLQFDASTFDDPIPELYHYTWFTCRTFNLIHYISLLSALRNMIDERARIVFHTDCEPNPEHNGHWRNLKTLAKEKLIIQPASPPTHVWDRELGKIEHVSDIYRLLVLLKFGGIYCDDDMILLKKHNLTHLNVPVIGEETAASLANGFMMSPPDSVIFLRWLQEYKFYKNIFMGPYSVMKIWALWRKYRRF